MYPVCAINPEDALSTVPMVIKTRFAGVLAEGETKILNADTKKVALTARLNPDKPKRVIKEYEGKRGQSNIK